MICKRSYDISRLRFSFLSFRFCCFFGRCFGINQLIRASIRARISNQWVFADWVNRSRHINHSNDEWKAQQKTKMPFFVFEREKTIYAERITIIEIDNEWNWFLLWRRRRMWRIILRNVEAKWLYFCMMIHNSIWLSCHMTHDDKDISPAFTP